MNIIQCPKKIRARSKVVAKRGRTYQQDLQEVLISGALHYRNTNDNTLLTNIVNDQPEGIRKDDRMIPWIVHNFQCTWDDEKLRFKKKTASTFLTDDFDVEKYAASNWWEFGREATPKKMWELMRKVKALTRDIEKHEVDARKQAIGALEAVNELTDKLHQIGCAKVAEVGLSPSLKSLKEAA